MKKQNKSDNCITVVMCEPNRLARITTIGIDLASMQEAVGGGLIEAIYPFDESVCLVCNEEGKIKKMPLNRSLKNNYKIVDIIAGPFFICGCEDERFTSLTDQQQKKYKDMFDRPELFFNFGRGIEYMPYTPMNHEGREK